MDVVLDLEPSLSMVARSTVALSELEASRIRQIITKQECKLELLTGKITEAKALLCKLFTEEAQATRIRDTYRSLLSPIRRLPAELLGVVFVFCLPNSSFVLPEKRHAPLLLTRICSSWRTIALSTPELWSRLRIVHHVNGRGQRKLNDIDHIIAPFMALWLSRSGSFPLSISITGIAMKQSILDVLSHHSSHCRRLELIRMHSWSSFRISHRDFPILRRLHVHSRVPDVKVFPYLIASAPELVDLRWEVGSHVDGPSSLTITSSLPWAQLKRILLGSSTSTSIELLLDIFAMCPLLEYADIPFSGGNDILPRAKILLPYLSSLVLSTFGPSQDYTPIFTYLTAPRLRSLTCIHGSALPRQILQHFINRSSCALENLDLRNLTELAHITEYLQIVGNSLKSFTLCTTDLTVADELLNALTLNLWTPCLCPNLETLNLMDDVSRPQGALAAMVRSRLQADEDTYQPVNTRSVRLKNLGIRSGDVDFHELRHMQQLGLILNIVESASFFDLSICDSD